MSECVCLVCVNVRVTDIESVIVNERVSGSICEREWVCVCVSECFFWCVNVRVTDRMSGRVHERVNLYICETESGCVFVSE